MTENKRSILILTGIIGILLVLLAGSIGYILGNSSMILGNSVSNSTSIVDDKKVMTEIEELKKMYDSKIAEKTNNYRALEEERGKVQLLVFKLEKTKNDANALLKYKTQYQSLESKMKILIDEIVVLKTKKTKIEIKQTLPKLAKKENKPKIENGSSPIVVPTKKEVSSKLEINQSKSNNFFDKKEPSKSIEQQKPIIEVKKQLAVFNIEKLTKITLSNVRAMAFSIKSNIKLVETNASNKAELIKINFTVDGIANSKSGEKTYYIQIINSKNNVVGKRITEYFDNESLTYSLTKTVNYSSQESNYSIEFPYNNFEEGTYFINIFDRNDLVGKTSFTLK